MKLLRITLYLIFIVIGLPLLLLYLLAKAVVGMASKI